MATQTLETTTGLRAVKRSFFTLKNIRADIRSVKERDPAARGTFEILLVYPGLHALWGHRLAHWLWTNDIPSGSEPDRDRDPPRGKHRERFFH
jgi:hypothetical protein